MFYVFLTILLPCMCFFLICFNFSSAKEDPSRFRTSWIPKEIYQSKNKNLNLMNPIDDKPKEEMTIENMVYLASVWKCVNNLTYQKIKPNHHLQIRNQTQRKSEVRTEEKDSYFCCKQSSELNYGSQKKNHCARVFACCQAFL